VSFPALTTKDRPVRKIENCGAFVPFDGSLREPLLPNVVRYDHMVRKGGRNAFDPKQQLKGKRLSTRPELACIKLWQHVVDVQDNFAARQSRQPRRKHQTIRDGVDMNQIVTVPDLPFREEDHGSEQKQQDPEDVGTTSSLGQRSFLDPE
jgi:hypothetical protein